jgi:nitronate monooxygenase
LRITRAGLPVLPWPYQGPLTLAIRRAALKQERRDLMFVLAGQGAPFIRAMPAASLIREFLGEYRSSLKRLAL